MIANLDLYLLADRVFFEDPARLQGDSDSGRLRPPALPPGWRTDDNGTWITHRPENVQLPRQGWKIHVAAVQEHAERTLETVAEYCYAEGLTFKHLRTLDVLRAYSFKYAPRSSASKLITLYPEDDTRLEKALRTLETSLTGLQAPRILGDLRWGETPLHVRYGGFTSQYCEDADGRLVLAVEEPGGELVPDRRGPVFRPPAWAPLPACLAEHTNVAGSAADFPYRVEEALHFSNGGGVYLATGEHGRVVLKEARPLAGLDGAGRDAVQRLATEEWALRTLDGTSGVPRLYDTFQAGGHRFLAMEYVDGDSLQRWLALRHPLTVPEPDPRAVADYTEQALGVLRGIEELVAAVHAKGVAIRDLHPGNIIVRENGSVALIDYEAAAPVDDTDRPRMGNPGFVHSGLSGSAADLYALAALRLWLFVPLNALLALTPRKAEDLIAYAENSFPLPPGYADDLREHLVHGAPKAAAPDLGACPPVLRRATEVLPEEGDSAELWTSARGSLVRGILATATPERDDRLFPGGYEQFPDGGWGFAHGAAGVLWALRTTPDAATVEGAERMLQDGADWLRGATARTRAPRPGFYDGLHGAAHVLDLLGDRQSALALVERAAPVVSALRCTDLYRGLSGIGLGLLHLGSTGSHPEGLAEAVTLAGRVATRLTADTPDPTDPVGLLYGWSGAALFLIRLYERTGDPALLDLAVQALHRDLDRCVPSVQGTLQVDEGFRTMPYLAEGSAGIALVAAELLRHREDDRVRTAMGGLTKSCAADFVLECGLFAGRAGLIGAAAQLHADAADRGPDSSGTVGPNTVERHLSRLGAHALAYRGHLAFPGRGQLRLSTDVATGSAGLLLALGVTAPGGKAAQLLPFLTPMDSAPRRQPGAMADQRRGTAAPGPSEPSHSP
ncbi:class III lanthionine synthetase LanKC [Streptomyces pseudoechinosporeus]